MKVKEVADLVGISVRTLHHYDKLFINPDDTTRSGYQYSDENLETLQQILFLGAASLEKIKEIIHNPSFDRKKRNTA